MGPTSIIWWTAGVSGMVAPAIAAMRGLHTPHAMTRCSVSIRPRSVTTARIAPPSTSMLSTSVLGRTVRASRACAFSRMMVPARRESTTVTPGL